MYNQVTFMRKELSPQQRLTRPASGPHDQPIFTLLEEISFLQFLTGNTQEVKETAVGKEI